MTPCITPSPCLPPSRTKPLQIFISLVSHLSFSHVLSSSPLSLSFYGTFSHNYSLITEGSVMTYMPLDWNSICVAIFHYPAFGFFPLLYKTLHPNVFTSPFSINQPVHHCHLNLFFSDKPLLFTLPLLPLFCHLFKPLPLSHQPYLTKLRYLHHPLPLPTSHF